MFFGTSGFDLRTDWERDLFMACADTVGTGGTRPKALHFVRKELAKMLLGNVLASFGNSGGMCLHVFLLECGDG